MSSRKPHPKKIRLARALKQNRRVPLLANVKKLGVNRLRTRRIRNLRQRRWRRDSIQP